MSAPPISSPLTNTCGIVGQPEIAESSWRIAGSGRMSTAVTGAPAARSARSARSELPHMTNCGVPFMKSATGSLSMTVWIRSRSSLIRFLSWRFAVHGWFRPAKAPQARRSRAGAARAAAARRTEAMRPSPGSGRRRPCGPRRSGAMRPEMHARGGGVGVRWPRGHASHRSLRRAGVRGTPGGRSG